MNLLLEITFDPTRIFQETFKFGSDSSPLFFGCSFVMEFALFAVLAISCQKELDTIIPAHVRYEGILRDSAVLANAVETGVICILHGLVKELLQILAVGLDLACASPLFQGSASVTVILVVSTVLVAAPGHFFEGLSNSVGTSMCKIISQLLVLTRLTMWMNSPKHGVSPVIFP